MKLVVIGAGGGLGRNAIDAALAAGHDVRAFVRDPAKLELDPAVSVIAGDAGRADDVARALAGMDAAPFCVNPPITAWLTQFPPLIAAGSRAPAGAVRGWCSPRTSGSTAVASPASWSPSSSLQRRSRGAGSCAGIEDAIRGAGIRYAMVRLPEFYGPHVMTLTPA